VYKDEIYIGYFEHLILNIESTISYALL